MSVTKYFWHRYYLDPVHMPAKIPALFKVTGTRNGCVYFRPVYVYTDRVVLGLAAYEPKDRFERQVGTWCPEDEYNQYVARCREEIVPCA